MQPRTLVLFPALLLAGGLLSNPAFSQSNLPLPSDLELTVASKSSAIISAKFSSRNQPHIRWEILGRSIVLNDIGTDGDAVPGDGRYSATLEFDLESFLKRNHELAKTLIRDEPPLFPTGSRQEIKKYKLELNDSQLNFTTNAFGQEARFTLPIKADTIRNDRPLKIPSIGLPLGIPSTAPDNNQIDIGRSLMITDVKVVNDPDRTWACRDTNSTPVGNPVGEWTFWSLMENINNGTSSTSDYIRSFFKHWAAQQNINSFDVPARPNVYQQIIDEWSNRSGGDLRPEDSPFRLLAILPRIDLRGGKGPYGGGEAGEGRLVFALHDGKCNNLSKTIILEYKTPIESCEDVRDWARKWRDLSSSTDYLTDLTNLTRRFTTANANPQAPNGSAIGQIRTNEFLPGSSKWEMREFILPRTGGFLAQTDVKQEPHDQFNNSPHLADFLNNNWGALVGPPAAQHIVPLFYSGTPFAAGASPMPMLWNVPNNLLSIPTSPAPTTAPPATIRDDALFEFALNTCSGCHLVETHTHFAHVDYDSPPGQPALLSGFLTGLTVPDARNPAIPRHFNDLARRAVDLTNAANANCDSDIPSGNQLLDAFTRARLNSIH